MKAMERIIKQIKVNHEYQVKIVPLGGVEEIGINCTAIEINNEIIVIDAGMGFPENNQYGVDLLIPNTDYLDRNKQKITALFITHSHLDHIGGLHIILPRLNFPKLYAPKFATELIKSKLIESNLLDKVQMEVYDSSSHIQTKHMLVEFFKVNHSAPDSYGISIKTQLGYVVHSGDFKFDNSPVGEEPADYGSLARLGKKGVIALLSDSTNSFRKGHSRSESEITEILAGVVEKAEGRIIVATFSQLVLRINQLLIAAKRQDRKVSITGRSLENTIKIARKLKYIDATDDLFVPIHKINKFPKTKQMIFTTGHQGETMAALSRIARGEHRDIKIKKGDTIIMSSSIIPGNELTIQKMVDQLSTKGAKVYHQKIMDLHAGGHGYQEDQKLMINLTKPKFFIPVHGYQSFLAEHGRTAMTLGIKEQNILIAKRGQEIIITQNRIKTGSQYRSKPFLVSGFGVGDIGDTILSERDKLANNGILIVNITTNKSTKELEMDPQLISKGFVFFKSFKALEGRMIHEVANTYSYNKHLEKNTKTSKIYKALRAFIKKELDREPEIVINIF